MSRCKKLLQSLLDFYCVIFLFAWIISAYIAWICNFGRKISAKLFFSYSFFSTFVLDPLNSKSIAESVPEWLALGCRWIGGCCGSRPPEIAAVAAAVRAERDKRWRRPWTFEPIQDPNRCILVTKAVMIVLPCYLRTAFLRSWAAEGLNRITLGCEDWIWNMITILWLQIRDGRGSFGKFQHKFRTPFHSMFFSYVLNITA